MRELLYLAAETGQRTLHRSFRLAGTGQNPPIQEFLYRGQRAREKFESEV